MRYTTVGLGEFTYLPYPSEGQRVTIDGARAHRTEMLKKGGAFGFIAVPGVKAMVYVTAPNIAKVRAVLDTVHIAPIDSNGCADDVTSLASMHLGHRSGPFVYKSPASATACFYRVRHARYRLISSSIPSRADLKSLVTRIDAGTVTTKYDVITDLVTRYAMRYTDGITVKIDTFYDQSPHIATDGTRKVTFDPYIG